MSQHTPGPWEAVDDSGGSQFTAHWRTIRSTSVRRDVISSSSYSRNGDEICGVRITKADADLIAAAPELLDALRAFVEPWSMGGRDWMSKLTYDTFSKARDAIAKATGGQP